MPAALAYDWLYNDLTDEQRRKYAAALVGMGLSPKGGNDTIGYDFLSDGGGGIFAAIAAYGAPGVESAPIEAALAQWEDILGNPDKGAPIYADGCWWPWVNSWYGISGGGRGFYPFLFKAWSVVDPEILKVLRPHLGNMVKWSYFVKEPHTGLDPWMGKCGFGVNRWTEPAALLASMYEDPVAQWWYHRNTECLAPVKRRGGSGRRIRI
jgi:hypothetical protein